MSRDQVLDALFEGADEYANDVAKPLASDTEFVLSLYRCALHRPADLGVKDHVERLRKGATREEVVRDFLRSEEYVARHADDLEFARDAYQAVLGREPTRRELREAVGRSVRPAGREELVDALLAGEEYRKIARQRKP